MPSKIEHRNLIGKNALYKDWTTFISEYEKCTYEFLKAIDKQLDFYHKVKEKVHSKLDIIPQNFLNKFNDEILYSNIDYYFRILESYEPKNEDFQYKFDEELAKSKTNDEPFSLMMIDIDDFKKFNDTYGHMQGDFILKKIAQVFKNICRKIDIVCRYGGEEFAIIIPFTNKEDSLYLAERIRKTLSENEIAPNRKISVSIGISSYPIDGTDKQTLIKKADNALYQAKRQGKNQIILV